MESKCVSVNIGPPANDKVVCELSDSDHLQHPGDLKPRHGWTYTGTEVWIVNKKKQFVIINSWRELSWSPDWYGDGDNNGSGNGDGYGDSGCDMVLLVELGVMVLMVMAVVMRHWGMNSYSYSIRIDPSQSTG